MDFSKCWIKFSWLRRIAKREKIWSKLWVQITSPTKIPSVGCWPLLEVMKKMNNTVVPDQWQRPSFFRSWVALLITWLILPLIWGEGKKSSPCFIHKKFLLLARARPLWANAQGFTNSDKNISSDHIIRTQMLWRRLLLIYFGGGDIQQGTTWEETPMV